uniref:Uncharacterized protein n=1 Tax=Sus scrofa TaxID=9823 RepID=A0A4X1U0U2_PIG
MASFIFHYASCFQVCPCCGICRNLFIFLIFFGPTCSMRKFLAQGSYLCHSSDSTRSLIHGATRKLQKLLLFIAEYSTAWIDHILSIHSSVDGFVGGFQFGAIVNSAAVDTHAQVFIRMYILISLGCMLSSGIAVSYDNSGPNILRNCQPVSNL